MSSNHNVALRKKFVASINTCECFACLGQATCASTEEGLLSKSLIHRSPRNVPQWNLWSIRRRCPSNSSWATSPVQRRATEQRKRLVFTAARLASVFRRYNTFRHAVLSIHLRTAPRRLRTSQPPLQEALLVCTSVASPNGWGSSWSAASSSQCKPPDPVSWAAAPPAADARRWSAAAAASSALRSASPSSAGASPSAGRRPAALPPPWAAAD